MNAPLKNSMLTMFKSNLKILARSPICLALLFCLSRASLAGADAIYTFSLDANGSVSALSVQLTFPALLPAGGLGIFPLTGPQVTSFTFATPGLVPSNSVVGLLVTPTTTFVGLSLRNAAGGALLLTIAPPLPSIQFPGDFFSFPRLVSETGIFPSTSGNVVSVLPLNTPNPIGTLTVTSTTVPEPATALLVVSGLFIAALGALRRRE